MLNFTKATDYALCFLVNLSARDGLRWSISEAAKELKIPKRFLANIVHTLAKGGIVRTTKGAGGGVKLEKDPSTISVFDVVRLFEGRVMEGYCRDGQLCPDESLCRMMRFWERLRSDILSTLKETSIKDMGAGYG